MPNIIEKLIEYKEKDDKLKKIFDEYGKINKVYTDTLTAMGLRPRVQSEVKNSSDVTIVSSNDSSNIYNKLD